MPERLAGRMCCDLSQIGIYHQFLRHYVVRGKCAVIHFKAPAMRAEIIVANRITGHGHTAYQEEELFELAAETLAPIDITVLGNRMQAWFVTSVAQAA